MSPALEVVIAGLAGFAAGGINAVAGGGTLVSFPTLVALGVPAVHANVTNTVALVPGYLGGAVAQRRDLFSYVGQLRIVLLLAAIGGLTGSTLLIASPERLFRDIVPWLIIVSCVALASGEPLKRWLADRRTDQVPRELNRVGLCVAVFLASVYGGYFGAGLGIMFLAVLGLALDDPLPKVNAVKQVLSLTVNLLAAAFFVTSGRVEWHFAVVMAVTSLIGGNLGGRMASRLPANALRATVVGLGLVVATRMLLAN
jgi:uncharacterized membrane protein YfcA